MPELTTAEPPLSAPPFDAQLLDALLDEAGLDAVIASSPHNLRYLLGGYRFFLYDKLDAVGVSRYAPLMGYVRGRPDMAFYVAWGDEGWGLDVERVWAPHVESRVWTARDAARRAAELLGQRLPAGGRVGVELPFLPADAHLELQRELPAVQLDDAVLVLDELRAVKSDAELAIMREGAEAVVEAMRAVFDDARPGQTTSELAELLRQHETRRGLDFDYCLIATAPGLNRAPSAARLDAGAALSLDSGASWRGYVADLARMGVAGEPSTLQQELLAMVAQVQEAARSCVAAGRLGAELMEAAQDVVRSMPHPDRFSFVAHGMGLRSHEAPRLNVGKPPYPATHRDRPLQAGMVLSIETHVTDPQAGFVKLEDAVFVTQAGCEPVADDGRGWNPIGGRA